MTFRIGSLCSGYGGLEMGVQAVYGGTTAWVSDIDKGACKILAHRFPGVPNIGDMTAVDWSTVEPVDLICGGTPCQDLSHAGKRAGMTEGTRSNLWVSMREAIATIRPQIVVWENVGGAYSAAAASEVERESGLLGDGPGRPALRALGRVLGDLASLGYDASWHGLRAADVGAPHGRFRVFVTAWDTAQSARRGPQQQRLGTPSRSAAEPREPARPAALLPSPRKGQGTLGETVVTNLLPTPAVNDMGEGKTVKAWDEWTERMKAKHGNGNRHGPSLSIEAQRLLPTPRGSSQRTSTHAASTSYRRSAPSLEQAVELAEGIVPREIAGLIDLQPTWAVTNWGQYAAAITRWESLTRPAPAPTETGPKGNPRLAAAFSEWLMGLPAGWVTDVPGITRNEALRALGNGVVPQQAAEALRVMAAWDTTTHEGDAA